MTIAGVGSAVRGAKDAVDQDRLQRAMRQLEAVFVQQMFKAMRETVPDEGMNGGSGEQIFSGMLDEKLAEVVPAAWNGSSLERALMRQFSPVPNTLTESTDR